MIVDKLYISVPVFEVMEPLIITLRIFGLFPISYTKNGNTYILKWSVYYGLYSYLLSVVLAIATIVGLTTDLKTNPKYAFRMTDDKTRFVTGGDISIIVIIVVFSTATLHSKMKKFWKLMIILNKADEIIPFRNFKRLRKVSIFLISTVLAMIVFIFSFDIYLKSNRKNRLGYLKTYFSFYILYTIVIMIEVFYWHIIFFIKIRIFSLNKDLKAVRDLQKNNQFSLKKMIGKSYLDNIVLDTNKCNNYKNPMGIRAIITPTEITVKQDREASELAKWLLSLSMFQNKIFEAVTTVNNSVELCIHIIMLSCLLHLIVTPYFLLVEVFGDGNIFSVLLEVIWVSGHIGRILIIVEPCQDCINEHEKTSNLVCELLMIQVDERVKNALTVLLLQLSYCKLNFSSCGFFKINRSLLTSIAGAVTTYLVILFQFKDT